MTKNNIIRMAMEAGFDALCRNDDFSCNVKDIERLVIAAYAAGAKDERELLEALEAIMRYPKIREYVGSELGNKADAAIEKARGKK